jgi:ferredoxin
MGGEHTEMSDEVQEKPGPGGLTVIVDRAACIGAADCVAAAPAAFRLDERSRVVLLDPTAVDERTIRRAAERCPTDAIILEDANGQQVYP